ncbi:MAG: GGDEF domain-containing protein [Marinicellaceae bacterium]
MRIVKALLPVIAVILLAMLARDNYAKLTSSVLIALDFLPGLLIVLVIAVAVYFNRLSILLGVLVFSFVYICHLYNWLDTELNLSLIAITTPILLLFNQIFTKQSILSIRSIPIYLTFIVIVGFCFWIIDHNPTWAVYYIEKDWLPAEYFNWSKLPQSALASYCFVFIGLLIIFSKKQNLESIITVVALIATYGLMGSLENRDLVLLISSIMILNLIALLQKSRQMAYVDELTLLPGRRALEEKLQSLVGIYTIAMVDIDHFKKFNDKFGHDTGDDVLRMIASKLNAVKGGGSAYRYGGEEFTIVFSNKSTEQTLEQLEAVRENIAQSKFVVNRRMSTSKNNKSTSVKITVSIGVADSIDITNANEVIKKADIALYKSKKKGRNCIT